VLFWVFHGNPNCDFFGSIGLIQGLLLSDVRYTPDQIQKMEESMRIRKASEPLELVEVVRPISIFGFDWCSFCLLKIGFCS